MKNEIVLFEAKDGKVSLPVQLNEETVWLTRMQMAELFEKDRTVILRHIQNAIEEGEIDPKVSCAKFAQVTPHGAIVIGYIRSAAWSFVAGRRRC